MEKFGGFGVVLLSVDDFDHFGLLWLVLCGKFIYQVNVGAVEKDAAVRIERPDKLVFVWRVDSSGV